MTVEQLENKIPKGKYTFIGIDIDTTGRRILDEIVHLAAYNPNDKFDQYIIPVMNLNPAARQRHELRIITVGFFRMLKCTLTNKVVKCKTEIVALKKFLDWLEQRKIAEVDSQGIILVYNEPIKFTPYMLLEALKKYDLVDRFGKLVFGFVDGNALVEANCNETLKIDEIRQLIKEPSASKEEDHEKNFDGNAMVRARNAYKILWQLAKQIDANKADDEIPTDLVQGFVHSVNVDINELTNQNKCIDLQHTFRPVFLQFFRTNLYHRYKAVTFRRVLAEKGFDLKSLESVWNAKKKDGITEIVSNLVDIKEENREELIEILDSYFDPEKEAIVPKSNRRRARSASSKENRRPRLANKSEKSKIEMNNNETLLTSDSTNTSPRRQRRHRKRFSSKRQNNNITTKAKVDPPSVIQLPHNSITA